MLLPSLEFLYNTGLHFVCGVRGGRVVEEADDMRSRERVVEGADIQETCCKRA
jgi:hypothetical protein